MGNKLKPLLPPPPVRGEADTPSRTEKFSSIVEAVETKTRSDKIIAGIKQILDKLVDIIKKMEDAVNLAYSLTKSINDYIIEVRSLNKSLQNVASRIDASVKKAGEISIDVKLQPKYKEQLDAYNRNVVEQENKAREELFRNERELLTDHFYRLSNLMHNNGGTWLSKRVFLIWMVSTFVMGFVLLAILTVWIISIIN